MDLAADLTQAVWRQQLVDRLVEVIEADDALSMAGADDLCAALLALLAKKQADQRPRAAAPKAPAPAVPLMGRRKAGRPRKLKSGPNGRTTTLLATLGENPGMALGDLARATYGTDDETSRNRTRSLLASLKKRKPPRVRNTGTGKWEVVSGE